MLYHVHEVTPFEAPPSSLLKIVIHVRCGDLLISPYYVCLLPNIYYINLSLRIIKVLKRLEIPFSCELHTEIPSQTFVVTPEHHSMRHRLEKPVIMNPENHHMEEFDIIPNLKKYINYDPLGSLRLLATADLVIMNRFSFSYLRAMLNKKGIIVYHPFWCAAPLEWLDATHKPSFHDRLLEACLQWKKQKESLWTT
ncbi:MAG: hypothetical protein ACOYK6_05730 [Chthoniobacterales bacterium]